MAEDNKTETTGIPEYTISRIKGGLLLKKENPYIEYQLINYKIIDF